MIVCDLRSPIAAARCTKGTLVSGADTGFLSRNHFLLRRLHSLSGVIPVGAFLINHLLTNSLTPDPKAFDEEVHWIHSLPYLVFIEFGAIILPLLFHMGYGVVIALQGRHNVGRYGYADNWRYTLQRVTGWVAVVFIIVHLLHFRFAYLTGAEGYVQQVHRGVSPYDAAAAGFLYGLPMSVWMVFYSIGLVACVYHFANGLCTFCITWGITIGDHSRRRVSIGATVLGLVLLIWGFRSLWGLSSGPNSIEPPDSVDDHSVAVLWQHEG
ncbi:MAG: succinate dehydrogenase [Planctomycetota bacterium]|nr:MAG: succinate dehydrogenase [Planctomycetota bacterium]